jgi:hypothetical protein
VLHHSSLGKKHGLPTALLCSGFTAPCESSPQSSIVPTTAPQPLLISLTRRGPRSAHPPTVLLVPTTVPRSYCAHHGPYGAHHCSSCQPNTAPQPPLALHGPMECPPHSLCYRPNTVLTQSPIVASTTLPLWCPPSLWTGSTTAPICPIGPIRPTMPTAPLGLTIVLMPTTAPIMPTTAHHGPLMGPPPLIVPTTAPQPYCAYTTGLLSAHHSSYCAYHGPTAPISLPRPLYELHHSSYCTTTARKALLCLPRFPYGAQLLHVLKAGSHTGLISPMSFGHTAPRRPTSSQSLLAYHGPLRQPLCLTSLMAPTTAPY